MNFSVTCTTVKLRKMASSEDQEQRVRQIQRDYVGFLDDSDREDSVYETAIQEMVKGTAYV